MFHFKSLAMNNHFRIIYAKGIRLTLKDKTFKEAMELVWRSSFANGAEPLKMVFTSTGKMLYMDKNAFEAFLNGTITMQDLIQLTEIDELYRNRVEVVSNEQVRVDPGSLWKLKQKTLTLIDDDQHITHTLNLEVFEIAEPNL